MAWQFKSVLLQFDDRPGPSICAEPACHLRELRDCLQPQITQRCLDDLGGQRDISILLHDFLATAGKYHLDELCLQWWQRLVRLLVHINYQEPGQGIIAGDSVLRGGTIERAACVLRNRQGTHAGSRVAKSGVADAVNRRTDRLYNRGGARLLVYRV